MSLGLLFMTLDLGSPVAGSSSPQSHESEVEELEIQRFVERARDGDRAAAGKLYRLHARRVFRAIRPHCSNEAEAEEVLQEAFIKALGALKRYRQQKGVRFLSWLVRIGINTARTRGRKVRRAPVVTEPSKLEYLVEQVNAVPAETELEARRRALLIALKELDDRDREIVTLRYGAGLSAVEVAKTCGVREANVRKICQRRKNWLLTRVKELMCFEERESERNLPHSDGDTMTVEARP